jgi:hypothetical protein
MRLVSRLAPPAAVAALAAAALAIPAATANAKPCLSQAEMDRDMRYAATGIANGGYDIWGKFNLWMDEAYRKASGDPSVCAH